MKVRGGATRAGATAEGLLVVDVDNTSSSPIHACLRSLGVAADRLGGGLGQRDDGRRSALNFGTLAYVRRTTVKLSDELDARLRHEAQRRAITVSELTAEAIETHLGVDPKGRKLLASGAGRSGHHDISERIEEILAHEVQPR